MLKMNTYANLALLTAGMKPRLFDLDFQLLHDAVLTLIAMFVPQRLTWQMLITWTAVSIVTTMLLVVPNLSLNSWYVIRLLSGIASGVAMILSSSLVIQSFSHERRSVLSALHYAGIGVGISASAVLTWWLLTLGYHFDIIWLVAGIISLPLLWLLYAIRPQNSTLSLYSDLKKLALTNIKGESYSLNRSTTRERLPNL